MRGRRLALVGAILTAMAVAVACGGGDGIPSEVVTRRTAAPRATRTPLPPATATALLAQPTLEPARLRILALWLADGNRAWVGGVGCTGETDQTQSCRGYIFTTIDGGQTWQKQYQGNTIPTQIQFVDQDRGMALAYSSRVLGRDSCRKYLGKTVCPGMSMHVLASRDGGLHWSDTYSAEMREAQLALAPSDAWIVASDCGEEQEDCRPQLLRSTDDGQTWTSTELPISGSHSSVSRPTADDAWVLRAHPNGPDWLIATHDAGATWRQLSASSLHGRSTIFFKDAVEGWALVGGILSAGTQDKTVLSTKDGGQTWTRLAAATGWRPETPPAGTLVGGGYVGPIAFTSSTEGWMALPRAGLLHTSDGGVTWDLVYQDDGLADLQFVDANHGLAYSRVGLIMTSDGGASWRELPLPTLEPLP